MVARKRRSSFVLEEPPRPILELEAQHRVELDQLELKEIVQVARLYQVRYTSFRPCF
jgi:hypothetical protein